MESPRALPLVSLVPFPGRLSRAPKKEGWCYLIQLQDPLVDSLKSKTVKCERYCVHPVYPSTLLLPEISFQLGKKNFEGMIKSVWRANWPKYSRNSVEEYSDASEFLLILWKNRSSPQMKPMQQTRPCGVFLPKLVLFHRNLVSVGRWKWYK